MSSLLFRFHAAGLHEAWVKGRFRLAVGRDILAEYLRVLAYPRFGLSENEIRGITQGLVLPYCDLFDTEPGPGVCSDPDDDKFLYCALAAQADALVSGDKALLALAPAFRGIPILSVRQALNRYSVRK